MSTKPLMVVGAVIGLPLFAATPALPLDWMLPG